MSQTPHPASGPAGAPEVPGPTDAMGSKVMKASFWSIAGLILPQWYTFVGSIFLARLLEPSSYGELTLISFTAATVGTLLTFGFPTAVNRHIAEAVGAGRANEVRDLYRWAWRMGLVAASVALGSLWTVAAAGGQPRLGWMLAGVASATTVLHQIPTMLLMGTNRWRDARIVGICTGAASLVARVLVLVAGGGIIGMLAIDAVVGIVNIVATGALGRRAVRRTSPEPRPAPDLIRRTIRFGLKASIGTVITWVVFRRSEIFFLEHFSTRDQIAIYSLPFSLVTTVIYIPQAASFVLSPAFATLFGAGELGRIRDGFGRALRIVTTFTIALSAYMLVVARPIVLLVYGAEYLESSTVLRILLVTLPFVPLMTLSTGLLNSMAKQWFATIAVAFAAIVNLGLDLVLIEAYDAKGAAVANSIAQLVGSVPLILYARRAIGGVELGGFVLARVALVSTVSALAALPVSLLFAPWLALLAATAVFAVAFLAVSGVIPVLLPADARVLADLVGRRLKSVPRSLLHWVSGRALGEPGRS